MYIYTVSPGQEIYSEVIREYPSTPYNIGLSHFVKWQMSKTTTKKTQRDYLSKNSHISKGQDLQNILKLSWIRSEQSVDFLINNILTKSKQKQANLQHIRVCFS